SRKKLMKRVYASLSILVLLVGIFAIVNTLELPRVHAQVGGCSKTAAISGSTQEILPIAPGQQYTVCRFVISGDTLATTGTFKTGTGTTCGTGTVSVT